MKVEKMTTPLLQIRNLTVEYPTSANPVRAVNEINHTLESGKILGLVGESGCGKSTVLMAILGLLKKPGTIKNGEILFNGQDLSALSAKAMQKIRGKEIAMIFQDPQTTLNPVFPVGEQIRESLRLHNIVSKKSFGWPFNSETTRAERERVIEVMQEVGIPSPDSRYAAYPHQYSGGMQQRALIALALSCRPALLLADEPTTALDVTIQAQILDLMRSIHEEHGTSIILVTHDLGVAAEFCDSIAVMYAGRIVELGSVDEVTLDPQHPYTKGLLSCRPVIQLPKAPITPIQGEVPDLANLPAGCAFAPRCDIAEPVCAEGPVPRIFLSPGRFSRCLAQVNYERDPDWTWADRIEFGAHEYAERKHDAAE